MRTRWAAQAARRAAATHISTSPSPRSTTESASFPPARSRRTSSQPRRRPLASQGPRRAAAPRKAKRRLAAPEGPPRQSRKSMTRSQAADGRSVCGGGGAGAGLAVSAGRARRRRSAPTPPGAHPVRLAAREEDRVALRLLPPPRRRRGLDVDLPGRVVDLCAAAAAAGRGAAFGIHRRLYVGWPGRPTVGHSWPLTWRRQRRRRRRRRSRDAPAQIAEPYNVML